MSFTVVEVTPNFVTLINNDNGPMLPTLEFLLARGLLFLDRERGSDRRIYFLCRRLDAALAPEYFIEGDVIHVP